MNKFVQLGEIASVVMGQAPPGIACNKEGNGYPFVKAGEFSTNYPIIREWTTNPLKKAQTGDVLVCVVGATAGKVNLGIDCAIGRSVAAVRPCQEALDTNYLNYFLQTKTASMRHGSQGLAQGVITRKMLLEINIPLPPLEEQRRIAAILDKAIKIKNLACKAQLIAKEARIARLCNLLHDSTQHSRQYKKISELITEQPNNGIFKKNNEYHSTDSEGLPVIWVEQLFQEEAVDTTKCKKLSPTHQEIKKFGLRNHDILFCRSSLKASGIAKSNIYTGPDLRALFECHLIRISPDQTKINPIYLNECLELPNTRAETRRRSKTSTMTTIDQKGILDIPVPVISIEAQNRFAEEHVKFQEISRNIKRSLAAIDLVIASLMSNQFENL